MSLRGVAVRGGAAGTESWQETGGREIAYKGRQQALKFTTAVAALRGAGLQQLAQTFKSRSTCDKLLGDQ